MHLQRMIAPFFNMPSLIGLLLLLELALCFEGYIPFFSLSLFHIMTKYAGLFLGGLTFWCVQQDRIEFNFRRISHCHFAMTLPLKLVEAEL